MAGYALHPQLATHNGSSNRNLEYRHTTVTRSPIPWSIFDQGLRYHHHIQNVAKKGTKFSLAISRIAKTTWGPSCMLSVKKLFTAVVAPRMDRAASIWHRPTKYGSTLRPPELSKLETAQRIAMKAILGCFRTTSTAALEHESALLPPHLPAAKQNPTVIHSTFNPPRKTPDSHLPRTSPPLQTPNTHVPTRIHLSNIPPTLGFAYGNDTPLPQTTLVVPIHPNQHRQQQKGSKEAP